jgi:hypothetical protein
MVDPQPDTTDANHAPETGPSKASWLAWLAWGWLVLLLLATVAELAGWEDLRLALDFQRHFR